MFEHFEMLSLLLLLPLPLLSLLLPLFFSLWTATKYTKCEKQS